MRGRREMAKGGPRNGLPAAAYRAGNFVAGAPGVDRVVWWYSMGLATVPGRNLMSEELMTKVQDLIENMINPAVAGHGGFVQLVDVKDNKVYLQMGGGCQGCGAADVTLKQGIERLIKEEIPEIEEVLDTTDHASGDNPYYQPSK
jgi:Fe-S cluster biogenesis protein NfuA